MRLTKRIDIAVRLLMYCASHPERLVTKSETALACNVSEHHLAQVIYRLAQMGYLSTQRGRHGGIALARAPDRISVGDLFRRMEAELPLTECFDDVGNTCPLTDCCLLRSALSDAAEAFYARLDRVTLGELTCENAALAAVFTTPPRCGPRQSLRPAE